MIRFYFVAALAFISLVLFGGSIDRSAPHNRVSYAGDQGCSSLVLRDVGFLAGNCLAAAPTASPGGSVTLNQTNSAGTTASTFVTAIYGGLPTTGDLDIAYLSYPSTSTVTGVPANWTLSFTVTSAGTDLSVYTHVAVGTDSKTVTFTCNTSGYETLVLQDFSNADTTTPLQYTTTSATGTLVTTGAISPITPNSLPVGAFSQNNNWTQTAGAGYAFPTNGQVTQLFHSIAVETSALTSSSILASINYATAPDSVAGALIFIAPSAASSITQVGSADYVASGGSGVTSIPFSGLAATTGDTQVFFVMSGNNTGEGHQMAALPPGCVLVDESTNSGGTWIGSYICSGTLAQNPTFTLSAAHTSAAVGVEYSGLSSTVDAHSVCSLACGSPDLSTPITPVTAGDLFLAFFGNVATNNAGVSTAPVGVAEIPPFGGAAGAGSISARAYFSTNPALSAIQPSLGWTATSNNPGAIYLAVRSAAASTPTPCASCLYVATSANGGSDSNPGTLAQPFLTIQKAANVVTAGKTVIVGPGTYFGSNNPSPGCVQTTYQTGCYVVLFGTTGTSGNPITFQSSTQYGASINGYSAAAVTANNPAGEAVGYCMGFNSNVSYYNIVGFDITNCSTGGIVFNQGAGNSNINISQNAVHNIAELKDTSCSVYGNVGVGAGANGTANITVDRNLIHSVGRLPEPAPTCTPANLDYTNDHLVYIHGHNISITNNVLYDAHSGWSIQAASFGSPDGPNWLIANNTFGTTPNTNAQKNGDIVMYNASGSNPSYYLQGTIENNIAINSPNNYFVSMTYSGGAGSNWTIRNNFLDSTMTNLAGGGVTTGGGTITASANSTPNPLLVAPTSVPPNLALQAGSPALGAGFHDLNVPQFDFNGTPRPNPPAIGAYEAAP